MTVTVDLTDRDFKEPWRAQTAGAPLAIASGSVAEQSLATLTGSGIVQSVQFTLKATSPGSLSGAGYVSAFFEIIPNGESDTGEGIYAVPIIWHSAETSTVKYGNIVIPANTSFSNGCSIKVTIAQEGGTFANVAGVVHATYSQ